MPPERITALHEITAGQVVAIDGKTLRHSFDKATGKSAIHMVSAWATANHLSLGQVIVDQKSNEITAIPKLLELLELAGCLVTIDAMGCQTEIAEKVIVRGADYVLAVKGTGTGHRGVLPRSSGRRLRADHGRPIRDPRVGHGRDEHRTYYVCDAPDDLPDRSRWEGLKRIGMAINITIRNGKPVSDVRYYILSRKMRHLEGARILRLRM